MANYVSYSQILTLMRSISHKFDLLGGAFVIKGTKTFATLPSPSAKTVGFVYNVSDSFTTTADFVEGASKAYPAGTNVVVVNAAARTFTAVESETLATITSPKDEKYYELTAESNGEYVLTSDTTKVQDKTYYTVTDGAPAYKYDVVAGFIDVTAITDRIDDTVGNIAPAFSTETAYAVGDTVIYNDSLYTFTSAHAAGAWDDNDATTSTVTDLISSAEPDALTNEQMAALEGLL